MFDHINEGRKLQKARIDNLYGREEVKDDIIVQKGGLGSGRHKEKLTPISEEERSANESRGKSYDNTRDPKSAMYENKKSHTVSKSEDEDMNTKTLQLLLQNGLMKADAKEEDEPEGYQKLEDEGLVSDNDEDNVKKGGKGEGSRGGHVIGHTKSGKPIYGEAHSSHKNYKDKTKVKEGNKQLSSEEVRSGIDNLLQISSPQVGAFIGALDLCENFKDWKAEAREEWNDNDYKGDFDKLMSHFEENVKGEIVNQSDFYDDDYDEDSDDYDEYDEKIANKFEVEKVYPIAEIADLGIDIPQGMTHFMLLPVDYGRDDIGIAYMTNQGQEYYSKHLTGDY